MAMASSSSSSSLVVVYKCTVCQVYFDNYTKANVHLGISHYSTDLNCINKNNGSKRSKKSNFHETNQIRGIQEVKFPQPKVALKMLSTSIDKSSDQSSESHLPMITKKRLTPTPELKAKQAHPSPTTVGSKSRPRQEIKLDSLKAGEIETLIKDMYTTSQNASTTPAVRKSNRKVKVSAKGNDEQPDTSESDTGQETIPKVVQDTTPKQKTKADKCRDSDYSLNESSASGGENEGRDDDSGSDFDPQPLDVKPRKVKAKTRTRSRKPKTDPGGSSTNNYWCRICDAKMKEALTEHMQSHVNDDGKLPCPKCSNSYTVKAFNRHYDSHKDTPKKYECTICPKKYSQLVDFQKHQEHHDKRASNPKKRHACPICGHRYFKQTRLRGHFLTHLENNPFKCRFPSCGKSFASNYHLLYHVKLHVARETFNCDKCPASYSDKRILKRHVKRFHSENSKETYKVIKKMGHFVKSVEELNPPKDPPESPCSNEFKFEVESIHLQDRIIATEDQMDIHIKGERLSPIRQRRPSSGTVSDEGNNADDPEDGKTYDNDSSSKAPIDMIELVQSDPVVKKFLQTHPEKERSILDIFGKYRSIPNDFKCHICAWSGSSIYYLQVHLKGCHNASADRKLLDLEPVSNATTAKDQINLTCGSCGFQSESLSQLTTHINKKHGGMKKYHCTFCGKRFEAKSRKDLHEKNIHLTEKKYCCDKCDAKYSSSYGLKCHMTTKHDPTYKKKRFKCDICGASFSSKQAFTTHCDLHTNKKEKTTCKICKQTCSTIYGLRNHIQLIHFGAVGAVPGSEERRRKLLELPNPNAINVNQPIESGQNDRDGNNPDTAPNNASPSTTKETSGISAESSSAILGF